MQKAHLQLLTELLSNLLILLAQVLVLLKQGLAQLGGKDEVSLLGKQLGVDVRIRVTTSSSSSSSCTSSFSSSRRNSSGSVRGKAQGSETADRGCREGAEVQEMCRGGAEVEEGCRGAVCRSAHLC